MMRLVVVTAVTFSVGTFTIAQAETFKTTIPKGQQNQKIWENKDRASSDDVKILIKNIGDGKLLVRPGNTVVPGRSALLLLVRTGNIAIDDASGPDGRGTELEYDVVTDDFSMSYAVNIAQGTTGQKIFEVVNGSTSPGRFSITHVGGSGTAKVHPSNAELSPNGRPVELSADTKNIVIDSVSGESRLEVSASILEALH
jgi:hypothetical protein